MREEGKLVLESMNTKQDKRKEPLVFIATAPNELVANLWKDALEENGIHPLLKSVNLVTSLYVSPASMKYQIHVLQQDEEKAREVLAPFLEDED